MTAATATATIEIPVDATEQEIIEWLTGCSSGSNPLTGYKVEEIVFKDFKISKTTKYAPDTTH